ncbi:MULTISPECIES: STAS domain-containing protein [unclassified Streptomyces]|uniref:STAS domain-containing protein n=2 Tax=Streptomyces TaxID=1883 RepID=UPI0037F2C902
MAKDALSWFGEEPVCKNARMNDEVEVTVAVVDGIRTVRVAGEFDTDEADILAHALALPPDGSPAGTVVDLAGVAFADSSFLHTLFTARQHHERAAVPLVLAGLTPFLQRMLELTDLTRAFTIAPTPPAAADLIRTRVPLPRRR